MFYYLNKVKLAAVSCGCKQWDPTQKSLATPGLAQTTSASISYVFSVFVRGDNRQTTSASISYVFSVFVRGDNFLS